MKKKSIKHIYPWEQNLGEKECDEKNCNKVGNYHAPKSPNSSDKYIFCYDHIKNYNKRWNFFAGKSQKEIYEFQKNDFFENRPTKPFSSGERSEIKFEFDYFFDKSKIKFSKKQKKIKQEFFENFDDEIKESIKILELDPEFTEYQLKKKYKELVKKFHPDLNKDLLKKETKIKKVNRAYKVLEKFLKKL